MYMQIQKCVHTVTAPAIELKSNMYVHVLMYMLIAIKVEPLPMYSILSSLTETNRHLHLTNST